MDDALKFELNKLQLSKVTSTDKIIGRGAYGKVIEVYVHGTLCAAKEIHPILIDNVSAEESEVISRSFYEECVIASRIHHPNVVQMLGIYYPTPQTKLPWLVIEIMETNLKGFLENHEKGKVPLHFKLSILVDVAQGLEFLHGQDIIHRDLSSNNVLLTKHLVAKIADLGVAKVMVQSTRKTQTKAPGTPDFMPPEALKSKPCYGKPVDIFSLACVALHVMSHQWPGPKDLLCDDTMMAFTETQRREEYIRFCTQPELKELVELCLHNKPEQRPEISVVLMKLKQFKVTVEKQVPFATDNNFELFNVVQQANIQNQRLSTANKHLTEAVAQLEATVQRQEKEKHKLLQEKDQQIAEKDQLIQEKDQHMQKKNQLLQEKDQELQMMIALWNVPTYSKHHEKKVNSRATEPLFDPSTLPPPDFGDTDYEFVAQLHVDIQDDNQLSEYSTQLEYHNFPEAKLQGIAGNSQPMADPAGYPPVTEGYTLPVWLPTVKSSSSSSSSSSPVAPLYILNRDDEFSENQLEASSTSAFGQGQYANTHLGNELQYGNTAITGAPRKPLPSIISIPPTDGSDTGTQLGSLPSKMISITTGQTNSNQLSVSGNSPVIPAVPITARPTPEASQAPPTADSKYGKTNLNYLKDKLQHKKEVIAQTVFQAGSAGSHPQSTGAYVC